MYPTRQEVIEKLLNGNDSSEMSTGASSRSSSSSSSTSNQEARDRASVLRQRQWVDCEQFVEDNLREVYEKLPNLEKQIWGKLIVMEGNRRTAKAYLRHPLVTIDGSDVEFDGLRIGLSRFDNPSRTSIVYEIFNDILAGVKLKIDPDGNVWAKRACYSPIFLKPLYRNRANDLFMIDQRPAKVFDIKRFKEVLVHELKQSSPDRRKLEKCCLVCMKFSLDHCDLLKTPCWVVVVHLVAIELLNLVMPKDNELSSPSSSFTTSPAPINDFQNPQNKLNNSGRQNGKETVKRLYAKHHNHLPNGRDPPKLTSIDKQNGILSNWQLIHSPNPPPNRFFTQDSLGHARSDRACSSMIDLRLLPPNDHAAFNQPPHPIRNLNQWRVPPPLPPPQQQHPPLLPQVPAIPRRPQMGVSAGQRVFSMEALNGVQTNRHQFMSPNRPPFMPEPRMLAAQIERMQLQKWRSQDSGIASGSGSYGRK